MTSQQELEHDILQLQQKIEQIQHDSSIFWLLFGATPVFFMQAGFALLEAGSVRAKNTNNILLKNVTDSCLTGLIFWAVGYSFAYGEGGAAPNPFIGGKHFFLLNKHADGDFYARWITQFAFAGTTATIVSGAVAERCALRAYLIYTIYLTAFVYPVAVHFGWSSEGWLSARNLGNIIAGNNVLDYAGSGVVHMTGGACALVAAYIIGPRYGRFKAKGEVVEIQGHSTVLMVLETMILWFGWYGFNCSSSLSFVHGMDTAALAAVNTTLGAAGGGLTTFMIYRHINGHIEISPMLNGILSGLVSITGGCALVAPWAALLTGIIGGFIFYGASKMLRMLRIDDPLDASPIHLFCGAWGLLTVGLFATRENIEQAYPDLVVESYGLVLGGGMQQLGMQIFGMVIFFLWSGITCFALFYTLNRMGILRATSDDELAGLDVAHGGCAYKFSDQEQYFGDDN